MALSGWNATNKLKLIIDGSKIEGDLTDFPVNITLSSGTGQTGFDATAVFDELDGGIDSTTKLMLHMDDAALSDSSLSSHAVTKNGAVTVSSGQSKFGGYSAYFDGDGDYLSIPDSSDWDFGSGDYTVDFWIRFSSFNTVDGFDTLVWWGTSDTVGFQFDYKNSTNELRFLGYQGGSPHVDISITRSWTPSLDTWYHITTVRADSLQRLFIGGVQLGSTDAASGAIDSVTQNLEIGIRPAPSSDREFNGYIDELRISKGIAKWTSNFTLPTSAYTDNRRKIAITDSNDNQLYTEIERWDNGNEKANLWVKVPTIISGTNTELYLYYDATVSGNTTYVGDTGDTPAQNVWDGNFSAVYHMSQDPSGGTDAIKDSTPKANHGTSAGSMTSGDLVDGKIGKGIDFEGTDDKINCGNDSSLDTTTGLTVEICIKTGQKYQTFIGKYDQGAAKRAWALRDDFFVISEDNTYSATWRATIVGDNLDDNIWHYVVGQWATGGKANLYVDGDFNNESSATVTDIPVITTDVEIARSSTDSGDTLLNGVGDEVRISNIGRTTAWIKATYYSNWNDLITFSKPIIIFTFSNPTPADLSTVYGTTQQLYLTTTITGEYPNYIYDSAFYNAYDDSQIGFTVSGTESGQSSGVIMNTVSGINYQWYMTATSSGSEDTSNTYTFTNKFLCEGQTLVNNVPASGIPVRLYRRSTGEYIGFSTSTGISGTFEIETDYNEYHYAMALYNNTTANAIIQDWLIP